MFKIILGVKKMDVQNLFGTIFNTAMNMKDKPQNNTDELEKVADSGAKSIFSALPNADILKGFGLPVPLDKVSDRTMLDIIKNAIVTVFHGVMSGKVKSIDDAKSLIMQSAVRPDNVMGIAGDLLGSFLKKN